MGRDVKIVPGLYKIFDEILVNAADNKIRDPNMDHIKVNVDRENGSITIWNNGRGIPIEIHEVPPPLQPRNPNIPVEREDLHPRVDFRPPLDVEQLRRQRKKSRRRKKRL